MPSVSVIIPVYRTEKYLPRCLDSLLVQEFEDFELILVDDGSPDNCGKICDEYANRDRRIKVIHQANTGVSAARNRGISEASGDYIVFVDSDDWVGPHYISDLMNSDSDFVGHSFITVDENGNEIKKTQRQKSEILITKDAVLILLERGVLGYAISKRFSRAIIQKYCVRFTEEINHTEDTLFIVDYLQFARNASIDDKANYYYIRYSSRETLSNHVSLERLSMACTANSIICKKLLSENDPRYEKLYYSRVGYNYVSYLDKVYSKKRKRIWKYPYYRQIMSNEDFGKIVAYEPDAVWKLSANDRIIRAIISKRRLNLFISCLISAVSDIVGRE